MKSLLLSGYKISINVNDGKLHIKDGMDRKKEPKEYIFRPKHIDLDHIIIYGHTGNMTLSAIKWLTKHQVQVSMLDYNGRLLSTINPNKSKQGFVRLGQYKAYMENRETVAKEFIRAKIKRTETVYNWLVEKYPDHKRTFESYSFKDALDQLEEAKTIKEIIGVEGIVSRLYWGFLKQVFPEKFGFEARGDGNKWLPVGAIDPINALFNYGYAYLESLCWKAINMNNLDAYCGFVHEMQSTKAPLVYDLQEPFRCLVDVTIIKALEGNVFKKNDFIRTDNYEIRIRPNGTKKLIDALDRTFSQTTKFKGMKNQWYRIIQYNARDFSQYLRGKRKKIDLSKPEFKMDQVDDIGLKKKILDISYSQWERWGFSRGTLWYMKEKAKSNNPLKLNKHVLERLNAI